MQIIINNDRYRRLESTKQSVYLPEHASDVLTVVLTAQRTNRLFQKSRSQGEPVWHTELGPIYDRLQLVQQHLLRCAPQVPPKARRIRACLCKNW